LIPAANNPTQRKLCSLAEICSKAKRLLLMNEGVRRCDEDFISVGSVPAPDERERARRLQH
jgi:hypothetical protein